MSRYESGHSSHKSSKHKRRFSSSDDERERRKSSKHKTEDDSNFTFLNHKSFFHRVLMGYNVSEQLVDDPSDFWLFLTKYENLLKRNFQNVLEIQTETPVADSLIPSVYNKNFLMSIKLKPSKHQLECRGYDDEKNIDEKKINVFLTIVKHYLDFKQKERFQKLKKLRKFQANLPIAAYEKDIVEATKNEKILIIAGDTGCGKSTQVPQYLYNAGFEKVACTQPRRIACIGLSKRVSHEMLCEYGSEVGYQIRFERQKTKHTKILFITEGLLLRQLSDDENLTQYSVIIIDEIHERNLYGDFLLGICKCLLRARPEIKIILMSATININLFANFFDEENARILEVPGRLFPIKLHYMPNLKDPNLRLESKSKSERLNPEPYIQIMAMIDKKYPKDEKGDLLIFVSGLNEIQSIVDAAKEYSQTHDNNWIILPLHSTLSMQDQDRVFDYAPHGMRKCVVSTNIAETSITIDGIRFVIDSGKMKEMTYDPNYKMQRLKEMWISKASAEQRKGRSGRTGPGICYRLYSDKEFYELENYTKAEIHRVPLESLLLQMISMGLPNARLFPFIEPPTMENVENSILALKQLEALTPDEKLTSLGKALSKIPAEVSLGKMLLIGSTFKQLQATLILAAILNVQSPFTNRAFRDMECEKLRGDCESSHGDPITLLNLYREWLLVKKSYDSRDRDQISSKKWCYKRGLEEQRFYEITKLKNQLESLLRECQLLEEEKDEKLTNAQRSIRAGEKRYLGSLRKAHKMEGPREKKLLKPHEGEMDEEADDGKIDIRDVEFRLSMGSKIDDLVLNATATSGYDLIMIKLILMSGLYPKLAISDEFNYCKSMNEQFFHTKSKPYISMHPMSYFAKNYQELNISGSDTIEKTGLYKSKCPLSSNHQLVCYLSILETTKPYLMNTMRMPAAQTLLLFAQEIDCNVTFSRIIFDSWLCIDFPFPESGQILVAKAARLRKRWNELLTLKLENEMGTSKKLQDFDTLERDLADYMNTKIFYTIKRLLPADLKFLYKADRRENCEELFIDPNPFSDNFSCVFNEVKGGVYVTENITYGCIEETDWSMQIAEEVYTTEFQCPGCDMIYNFTSIQKLQHQHVCKPIQKVPIEADDPDKFLQPTSSNQKFYKCTVCNKGMYLSNIDILKHKKNCRAVKEEPK